MAYPIDRRQFLRELSVADPILKREADRVMHEQYFDPAVERLKQDFENHPVTRELAGGVDATNESGTLDAPFREGEGDSPANLTSFIGFDKTPEEVLGPVIQRLDPRHPDGPKLVYRGRDKDKLTYRYEVRGPDEEAIANVTDIPWAPGISWLQRIEKGLSGIGHFLNVYGRPSSRSGGGIQIEGTLRSGRYRPVSYFSAMVNNFLRRAGGLVPNSRRP